MQEVIAERQLDFYSPRGRRPKKIIVRIGKAELDETGETWRAPIEILGPKASQVFRSRASGVDSMQAVIGAIWLVPVLLRTLTNDTGGRLEFEGSADLGFYMEPHEAFKPPLPAKE
ncbi:DUF6968 family protein [Polyangium mundeleinium]|uniref:DUF6968 domain-containing protein n=1 Tax=Polyangium mundeleinium TaxID=2995306 RepID=A0ABT5EP25_9BACT|nr:hypothetical protein [Polyangium mundeleinium]MDC0743597.1 hypothetical protein [Polyangium mundeleinium]